MKASGDLFVANSYKKHEGLGVGMGGGVGGGGGEGRGWLQHVQNGITYIQYLYQKQNKKLKNEHN